MKINRDELTGALLVSTNSIVNSFTGFIFVAGLGRINESMMESILEMLPFFQKTVDFAEKSMDAVTDDYKDNIKENLEIIHQMTQELIMIMEEYNEQQSYTR